MTLNRILLFSVLLSLPLHSQLPLDDDEKINILLSGKKSPGNAEIIAGLGITSLELLAQRLAVEEDHFRIPIYSRLIALKYRQFAEELTPARKSEILILLSSKIREIKDEGSSAYLIQSSLGDLQGINHPVIRQLCNDYLKSKVEWTTKAAKCLKASITATDRGEGIEASSPNALPMQPEPIKGSKAPVSAPQD